MSATHDSPKFEHVAPTLPLHSKQQPQARLVGSQSFGSVGHFTFGEQAMQLKPDTSHTYKHY